MTTVIETSNGWAVSATVTCSPTASAPTPRRGVGLIAKTASRSHAPNTWRGQLDWCPTRSVKDEQGGMWRKCDRARGSSKEGQGGGSILTQSPTEPGTLYHQSFHVLEFPVAFIPQSKGWDIKDIMRKTRAWPTVTVNRAHCLKNGSTARTS